jgi:hypothetical protein
LAVSSFFENIFELRIGYERKGERERKRRKEKDTKKRGIE